MDDGVCQFLAQLCATLVACAFLISDGFYAIYQADLFDAVFSTLSVMVQCTVKISAAVGPAAQDHYPVELVRLAHGLVADGNPHVGIGGCYLQML